MVEKNSIRERLEQKAYNLYKKSIFIFKDKTSFTRRYKFEDRSKGSKTVCIILSGYKEFLWDVVFERIEKFSNDEMDICIVSSGLYSERLSEIAKKNNWSYLSTKRNSVCLAQNMAIKLFPNAEYIYKLDEDIFITKNFFKTLKETYDEVQENGSYNVGFVAPLIPINGYSHLILLKKLGLEDYYNEHFEKAKFAAGSDRMIEASADVAKFFWGANEDVKFPHIDDLDEFLHNSPFSYSSCSVRFSIGAIYYSRDLWKKMPYFKVGITRGMGVDETQICAHCMLNSLGIVISENTCAGHLSFGPQNSEMERYFKENPDKFKIKRI